MKSVINIAFIFVIIVAIINFIINEKLRNKTISYMNDKFRVIKIRKKT